MITSKFFKKVAIILLIAVFSIACIVACGGGAQDIAGSRGGVAVDDPGPTGPVDTDEPDVDPTPEQPTFPEDTYYKIYAPWVKWDESQAPNGWGTNVSWQDTNTLTQIWKQQIEGGKRNDGNRWMIRDANNNNNDPRAGKNAHYYYFDKDFNLVYYRQGKGSLTIRKFLTGIIVKYRGGRNAGTWTIGGVYETLFSKKEINANNWDSLNIFMGHDDMRATKGGLEVLTMNTGYDDIYQNEFGVDFYYNKNVIGEDQLEKYTSKNPEELNRFFNGQRNLSWNLGYVNFRFVFSRPYTWHLENHLEQQGWH